MEPNQTAAALNVAIGAAREAGRIISQQITQLDRINVTKKSSSELVSEVDIKAEQRIIYELEQAYPEYNIIAEESGDAQKDSAISWVIDPLDGTHNFLHGHPHCAVSIALKENDDLLVAVIYDPFRNELFTARKGSGAQLDGRRIRVSETNRLADSLLCTGFPYRDNQQTRPWLKSFALTLPRAQSIHRSGSSVLDLAYIACGRYDAFWEYGLKPWDIAAGALLVQEAGGLISDISGDNNLFKSGDIIAGTPRVFEKLNHLLSNA